MRSPRRPTARRPRKPHPFGRVRQDPNPCRQESEALIQRCRANDPRQERRQWLVPYVPKICSSIASDAELAKMDEERLLKRKKKQQQHRTARGLHEAQGPPEAIDRINHAVSMAAKRGEHQIQVVTFPCTSAPTAGGRSTSAIRSGRARSRASPRRPTTSSIRSCVRSDTSSTPRSSAFRAACRARSRLFLKW